MSGLGTTVEPEGAPGSGTSSARAQAETLPDNPSTIAQSTAIQTLDQLLRDNWIYDSTFTVSTSMPAGTVVYTKPIHPTQWNWPNRRVAGMFNTWTGSGKIRYRPLATAWYGGSIRVGFLPPNIDITTVRTLPLEVLTSYPNRDIDPKNTDWVDFRGPDQREVAYHYMAPFDSSDRTNFGGYIIFYVAGKLVTQAPDFTTIQFVVETAGDFMFDQPNPLALDPDSGSSDPIAALADQPLDLQPLVDSMSSGVGNAVQVFSSTVTSLPNSGINASAVGHASLVGVPGIVLADASQYTLLKAKGVTSALTFDKNIAEGTEMHTVNGRLEHLGKELKTTYLHQFTASLPQTATSANAFVTHGLASGLHSANPLAVFTTPGLGGNPLSVPSYVAGGSQAVTFQDVSTNNPISLANAAERVDTVTSSPQAGGESIVAFVNLDARTWATQTAPIARALAKWSTDATQGNDSWLYNLTNASGTPLLLLRLNPNGVFSTNAVSADVLYPAKGLTLKYFGILPLSSPLPPMSTSQRYLAHDLRRAIRDESTMEELSSLLSFI